MCRENREALKLTVTAQLFCLFVFTYAFCWFSYTSDHMSRIVRKPDFCLCENKGADQLRGNREADQRLCFRYSDSTVPQALVA